jgi:hypothetical protein
VKGLEQLGRSLRARPLRTLLGLGLEYAGYVAACVFALLLVASRSPLAWLDRSTGWKLRERCIELIARVSPG